MFAWEGNPLFVVTDNGPQFLSSVLSDFLSERGIKHLLTSVYHPQGNGTVEPWNRVLKECILSAEQMRKAWRPSVVEFLQSYHATPHATTSVFPSELLHNRKMRTKVDIFPVKEKSDKCAGVRDTIKERQDKSKKYTDGKRRAKPVSFKVKEQVRIRKPDRVPKGSPKYTLPLLIHEKIGPSSFLLNDGKKWNGQRLTKFPDQIEKTV